MVPPLEGNYIQNVKFADKDSNEFVLVFMAFGDVFLLESQSEQFKPPAYSFHAMKQTRHELCIAEVPDSPIIDIKNKLVLAVSEGGKGSLHRLKYEKGKGDLG